jgi:RNA polymerase sigma factor (sigma-70 family)
MEKNIQEVLFNEILFRYNRLFYKVICDFFPETEDAKDAYQEFCIHLYTKLEQLYPSNPDLFDTKSWLVSVVKNFSISLYRKKNGKRKIKIRQVENKDLLLAMFKDQEEIGIDDNIRLHQVLDSLLNVLDKRDVLILKMKYYYGKPSSFIGDKMNEAHVDVYIGRLKKKIKKHVQIETLGELTEKFNLIL